MGPRHAYFEKGLDTHSNLRTALTARTTPGHLGWNTHGFWWQAQILAILLILLLFCPVFSSTPHSLRGWRSTWEQEHVWWILIPVCLSLALGNHNSQVSAREKVWNLEPDLNPNSATHKPWVELNLSEPILSFIKIDGSISNRIQLWVNLAKKRKLWRQWGGSQKQSSSWRDRTGSSGTQDTGSNCGRLHCLAQFFTSLCICALLPCNFAMPSNEYDSLLQPVTMYAAMWLANGMLADVMQEECLEWFCTFSLACFCTSTITMRKTCSYAPARGWDTWRTGPARIKVQPCKLIPMWQMFLVFSLTHTHTHHHYFTACLPTGKMDTFLPEGKIRFSNHKILLCLGRGRLDRWRINTPSDSSQMTMSSLAPSAGGTLGCLFHTLAQSSPEEWSFICPQW